LAFFCYNFEEIFLGGPCVVLCGIIKTQKQKNGKEPFQKALRSIPRLLWTKTSENLSLKKIIKKIITLPDMFSVFVPFGTFLYILYMKYLSIL